MRSEAGFSLIEILVALALLTVSMLGLLVLFQQNGLLVARANRRSDLVLAARNLLEEIQSRRFEDSDAPVFGVEPDEDPADKWTFDDVDDFCGWEETPFLDADDEPLDGLENVRLSVRTWYADDTDVDGESDTNGTFTDDNGRIEFAFDPPDGDTCADPGPTTRFKVVEVTASQEAGIRRPRPVVLRTLRFQ